MRYMIFMKEGTSSRFLMRRIDIDNITSLPDVKDNIGNRSIIILFFFERRNKELCHGGSRSHARETCLSLE